MEDTLKIMWIHLIETKMFHFQCETYGKHKASDDYFNKYISNFDKFFEVVQGIYGKFAITSISINADTDINNYVNRLKGFIKYMKLINIGVHSEIITMRDDIVNDGEQLIYLLTFK